VPVQQDVPLGCPRNLRDQCQCLGVAARLELRQQPRQDGRVVEDDRVGDQPRALVGPNPTLTLVANSSRLELECGEMGAAGLSVGCSVYPGRNSYHVDRDGGQDML
jgi:hypothetical protein